MVIVFAMQANAQGVQVNNGLIVKSDKINSMAGPDKVILGDRFIIDSSADGKERQFPLYINSEKIFLFLTQNILIRWLRHPKMQ